MKRQPSKKRPGPGRAKRAVMDPKYRIRVARNRKHRMKSGEIPWE